MTLNMTTKISFNNPKLVTSVGQRTFHQTSNRDGSTFVLSITPWATTFALGLMNRQLRL